MTQRIHDARVRPARDTSRSGGRAGAQPGWRFTWPLWAVSWSLLWMTAGPAQAQPPEARDSPGGRSCHAVAHLPGRGMVVLGGARFCGTQIIADRSPWLWDGRAWTRLPGEFPEAREDAQLAFDTRRNMLVSFGGRTRAGARSDTWEWNGSIWQLRSTGSDEPSPGPMEHAAMAYDARRSRVVLFGGGTRTGQMSGRTWEWDGRRWEMRSESGPAARVGHSMAFSPSDGVILYGGFNAGGSMRDLWKWDGSQWARLDSVGPTFTEGTSLVVTAEGPIVVGAGLSDSQPGMSRKSVWRWAGGRWQLLGERGPTLLVGQSVAYDPDRRRLVVFGGSLPNGNPLADVWELTDSGWLRVGPAR